ncbi:uncharacterized protein N7506_009101 [Penicillium brevicompactum]|uniref:uncharacterized protein n=1 Tax=Penicillium brevicompactum TaxID=5074 RepID=UPI002540AB62|nr:uncharacterized protein N7506_009101 [Penicillium brevicompactum]KAJ5325999.1 hypothetical protein N7506_009101 [Penicillium brevicompactum]
MSLLDLPIELSTQILSYLEYASDVCAFSQTHPSFYRVAQPRIAQVVENEDPPLSLVDAAKKGSEASVRKLLKMGARFPEPFKPSIATAPGDPMGWAAKNGHVGVVRLFLEHGRDPHPLSSCYGGPKEPVPANVSYWDPPLLRNPLCYNPLMLAAMEGHEPVVKLLIEHGVKHHYNDNAASDVRWEHPLTWAVIKQNIPIIKLLIDIDIDGPLRSSNRYNSPLHALALIPPTSVHFDEIFDLLTYFVDFHSCRGGDLSAFELGVSKGNVKFVERALHWEKINELRPRDITYLLRNAEETARTDPKMASVLMGQFDVNQAMRYDDAARDRLFRAAAAGGFMDVMKRLMKDYKHCPLGEDQYLPLLGLAAQNGHIEMYKLLSKREDTARYGPTNQPQMQEYDVHPFTGFQPPYDMTPEDSPMIQALHRGHYEMVKFLIDEDYDKVLASEEGPQLLFDRALFYGQTEIVQKLFDKRTAPPLGDIMYEDCALSICMAILGGEAVFRTLLKNEVHLDPKDHYHKKAFELAAFRAEVPILEIFLDAGFRSDMKRCGFAPASVSLHCEDGLTLPLIYAAHARDRKDAEAAVDLLLKRGGVDQSAEWQRILQRAICNSYRFNDGSNIQHAVENFGMFA